MKNMRPIKSFLILAFILLINVSAKIEIKPLADEGGCDKVIRYYINKVNAGGQEINIKMVVTANPIENTFTVEVEGQEKKTTKFEIKECTLNSDLSSGNALYEVTDERGEKDWMKIEAKEGKVIISNPKPATENENENISMTVEKWELVK